MRAALAFWVLAGLLTAEGGLFIPAARANEDPDTEVARRHFNAGRAFYDKAEYDKALDEFQAARRVRPHPALDYNIARCLDRLERYDEAIAAYERYAASNPPDGVEIRTRISQLKERLKAQPPKPSTPPQPPSHETHETVLLPSELVNTPPPAPPKSNKKTVAIVLGVIGGALVISAGIAVGLLVKTTTEPATPDSTNGPHPGTQ